MKALLYIANDINKELIVQNQNIHSAIVAINEYLTHLNLSSSTLKNYSTSFNSFENYLIDKNITFINEKICLDYIKYKTGKNIQSFECVVANRKLNYRMRPLLMLLKYLNTGEFNSDIRKIVQPFICPECFRDEYNAFIHKLSGCNYSKTTINSIIKKLQRLIIFLVEQRIFKSGDISVQHIQKFLKTIENYSLTYRGRFLYAFKKYFSFLIDFEYINNDLASKLPKMRVCRNNSTPHLWSKDDILKLLKVIDRNDPKGKRDYAILLIAIRLGLRIGDIRKLKQSSIDWNKKTITIIISKTNQPIELPLLRDVGWAIIDYIQNGRPNTNSDCIFVRHKAPFIAFADFNSFYKNLQRYIIKAGLKIPNGRAKGMHSFRSALAGNMLGKTPIIIISEALGHKSVNTTGIYLKIDIEGLRKCTLNPDDEVFNQ
jgi:site-specific recombinase XerD